MEVIIVMEYLDQQLTYIKYEFIIELILTLQHII